MASSTSFFMSTLTLKNMSFSKHQVPCLFSPWNTITSVAPNFVSIPSIVRRVELLTSSRFRFARNVAVSDYGQDLSQGREPSFSSDLKLFVGNLPFNVDSSKLAGLFGNVGTVEMVEVIYDKVTGRSRGFGFVTMSSVEEVEAAAQQFNGYELEGRPLRVNAGPAPPKRDDFAPRSASPRGGRSFDSSNRIHVGNLSWEVDDAALKSLFSEQGDVVEAKVIYDRDSGRSRGFGFVTYGSTDEVNSAIESLDGVDLGGRSIRVTVAESRQRRQF